MPRSGGVTRRGGDRMPVKDLWSHLQDCLQHGLAGIDRQARSQRREAAGQQEPPRTLVSQGISDG
jgi:hypothetical protein